MHAGTSRSPKFGVQTSQASQKQPKYCEFEQGFILNPKCSHQSVTLEYRPVWAYLETVVNPGPNEFLLVERNRKETNIIVCY